MSISSSAVRRAGPYTCSGATVAFPFSFLIFETTDVVVTQTDLSGNETVLAITSAYTVAMNANQSSSPGGTVTLLSAPPAGYLITLSSDVPAVQPLVLTNTGGFYPTVISTALDYLTVLVQQLIEQMSRAVQVDISSGINPATILASLNAAVSSAAASASSAASSLAGVATTIASAVASATSAAATSASNAATSATAAATSATNAATSASLASSVVAAVNFTLASISTFTNKTLLASGSNTVEATSGPGGTSLSGRNRIDNGAFTINQRYGQNSQTLPLATLTPASDRWLAYISGAAAAFQATQGAVGSSQLEGYLVIVGGAGSTNPQWTQRIESVRTRDMAGQPVALSCWMIQNTGSAQSVTGAVSRANSTDNFGSVTLDTTLTPSPATIPSGTWTKVTFTGTLTTSATTGLQVAIGILGTVGATVSAIGEVQLEIGTAATPFEREHSQQTLAKCQRYLPVFNATGTSSWVGGGSCYTTTGAQIFCPFRTAPRVPPTGLTILPAASALGVTNASGSSVAATGLTFVSASNEGVGFNVAVASGLAAGNGALALFTNASGQLIFTGAEL